MPCNGLNHHPECNCRFGGQYFSSGEPGESPDWRRQSSHTIPNAKCPHCRSQVLFYRSPEGGRVLFELQAADGERRKRARSQGRQRQTAQEQAEIGTRPICQAGALLSIDVLPARAACAFHRRQDLAPRGVGSGGDWAEIHAHR